jgi:hypothetical protein
MSEINDTGLRAEIDTIVARLLQRETSHMINKQHLARMLKDAACAGMLSGFTAGTKAERKRHEGGAA